MLNLVFGYVTNVGSLQVSKIWVRFRFSSYACYAEFV